MQGYRRVRLILFFCLAATVSAADHSSQIDELMAKHVSEKSPGAAILVVFDGKKVFEKGYGLAQIDNAIPIRPHTVFELASCSKQFTAMAIMMLAERKKLSYDDPLGKFFPEFHDAARAITVEQLLHHTGGLPDYMDAWNESSSAAPVTSKLMLDLVARHPKLRFKPGEKYEYSNTGYMVLAQIVENASGMKYPEFLKENIFTTLGMNDTLVDDETHPKIPRHALCYARKGDVFKDTSHNELNAVYGDGSVRSSIEDLYKWDQALYTEKLVSAETLKRAWTEGKTNNGKGTGYGYGWGVGKFKGTREVAHSGAWLDFNTEVLRLPDKKLSVIILSNLGKFDADAMAHKIAALYLKDE